MEEGNGSAVGQALQMFVLVDRGDGEYVARAVTWRERVGAHLMAERLDRALAAGIPPEADVLLAVRAQWLTRPRFRVELARSLQRLVDQATGVRPRSVAAPVPWGQIESTVDDLIGLALALSRPGPVSAQGVARARLLLADGTGPLWRPTGARTLHAAATAVEAALTPHPDW